MTRFRPAPIVVLPVALAAVFWQAVPPGRTWDLPRAAVQDREAARFVSCARGGRHACVIDGDTIRYRGAKIRLADINTPETGKPGCAREARLGAAATARLTELLNAGPFSLKPADRDRDSYGRALRIATRGGKSLGVVLTAEGLAEPWRGRRGNWCD